RQAGLVRRFPLRQPGRIRSPGRAGGSSDFELRSGQNTAHAGGTKRWSQASHDNRFWIWTCENESSNRNVGVGSHKNTGGDVLEGMRRCRRRYHQIQAASSGAERILGPKDDIKIACRSGNPRDGGGRRVETQSGRQLI